MILKLRFLLLSLITVHFSYAVDFDYYFSSLRSRRNCTTIRDKLDCQIMCGGETGMCIGSKCYCLSVHFLTGFGVGDDHRLNDFHEYNDLPVIQYKRRSAVTSRDTPEYLDKSLLYDKPILRHHIAHFCPNLDAARDCIRKCMTEGKPAFCGKDHVCYCGHRYSSHDSDPQNDPASVYAQFKDLYKKYFGPNYQPEIQA